MNPLSINHRIIAVAALLLLALACPLSARAQTARAEILAATARLEKTLAGLGLPETDVKQRASLIASTRKAAEADHLYLSLYRLQALWVDVMALSYAASKSGVAKAGVEAFEREWQSLGVELTEKEKRLAAFSGTSPAAVVALVEASLSQVRPYYQSGKLYGLNTTIEQGLYYMGLAPSFLDFALFCQTLRFKEQKRHMDFRALDAELARFEAALLESYRQKDTVENQLLYARTNSTLKIATELNREKRYTGAFQKYLESRMFLGLVGAPPVGAEEVARLTSQVRQMENRLKNAATDQSLGLFYWEMVVAALNAPAGGQPDAELLKRARVVVDEVLPAYFQYANGDK